MRHSRACIYCHGMSSCSLSVRAVGLRRRLSCPSLCPGPFVFGYLFISPFGACVSFVRCPSLVLYTYNICMPTPLSARLPFERVNSCLLLITSRRASGCGHRLPTEAVGVFQLGALKGDLRATPRQALGLPHKTKQHVRGERE